MAELRTDDLRELAYLSERSSRGQLGTAELEPSTIAFQCRTRLLNSADEIDRLRELVDILRSIPGASITADPPGEHDGTTLIATPFPVSAITDANYDALTEAIENPPPPNEALKRLMRGGSDGS